MYPNTPTLPPPPSRRAGTIQTLRAPTPAVTPPVHRFAGYRLMADPAGIVHLAVGKWTECGQRTNRPGWASAPYAPACLGCRSAMERTR